MTTIAKTVVATGCSSGLGFELVKQLLSQAQPYNLILGARNATGVQAVYDALDFDTGKHRLSTFPLELSDLKEVRTFAQHTLDRIGKDKIDYLLLNAGIIKSANEQGPLGSKWSEPYIVNHLSQHYLLQLLREKLVESRARIVFVSSGAIQSVKDTNKLDNDVRAGAGTKDFDLYGETKFIQLLNAHYWRRQLGGSCEVIAVSPGLIPGTGLSRHSTFKLTMDMPDAKSISQGATNILRAFTRDDFPEDPDRIFLTSWGEWWSKDVYSLTLDKKLQDKWSPSTEEIEKEEIQ